MLGSVCDKITPINIRVHPNIFPKLNISFSIIQAATAAKTPSSEKIIADGAGEIFFWANICNVKAMPPESKPA